MPGSLFLVATPIGNLEDITLRALRVLKQVDLIAAEDTRRTGHLLAHFGIATRTTSLHEHNEKSRVPGLVRQVQDGLQLAVVTDAGMPSLSDPGYLIVRQALDAGLKVEVIPGVSALTTALTGSGLPTDEFSFLGFAPSRAGERKRWLAAKVARAAGTVALFEAPGRLAGLLGDLATVCGDRYIVIAHELTKLHESWHRGWLSDLTREDGRLQLSQVAASSLFWYLTKNRPLLSKPSQLQKRLRSRRCSSKSVKTPTSAGVRRSTGSQQVFPFQTGPSTRSLSA